MSSSRHVIVGTAGHIDHGKTSLIRRLTGVDTDRLPEEKKRGITIVLGFAPLVLPNGVRVGVVDVPGHERFVKNMAAGAGGIDVALMVVAADEGVMPQTREHLEICQLLGVRHGVVALTKVDRAGELAELALEDVRAEMAGSFLERAEIIPCSAVTGEGIEALLAALTRAVEKLPPRVARPSLVLPIDRMFTMKGFGAVVTGTIVQGELAVGDTVDVLPAVPGYALERGARVRGLQVFKDSVERAYAGQRTAVNLQGVDLESIALGQSLLTPGSAKPTRKLSVQLTHLSSRKKKLKSGAKALVHAGTALVETGITLLESDALEPGQSGFATLRLAEPMAVLPGQRFIVRGFDAVERAGRTFGGGVILDPEPPRRRRKTERTTEVLSALLARIVDGDAEGRRDAALIGLVVERGPGGLATAEAARRLGMPAKELEKIARAGAAQKAIAVIGDRLVSNVAIDALSVRVLEVVERYHREHPYRAAIAVTELASRVGRGIAREVVEHTARGLVRSKQLADDKEGTRLPSHRPKAEVSGEQGLRLLGLIQTGGLEPPAAPDLQKEMGLDTTSFRELLAAFTRAGDLVHVAPTIYFSKELFEDARSRILAFVEENSEITTAQAKTLLGISRKYLIPLLETLDKHGTTVRVGESRKAKAPKPR